MSNRPEMEKYSSETIVLLKNKFLNRSFKQFCSREITIFQQL
ncbi:hypothetical protein LEP1GSC179_4165 [Leptospira santarosai str. MOR084]|uniref:Uncharacterized protein n=1 Tax=Leptospira santarosai str. MOR084 TaxID=1049984 RepID=A0A0E2BK68_9LEPT|nr:hypothetical protein LEP1GSC179_4165 [Leptospira santarosai str. MOR084]